jgi:hypothetical protein
MRFAIFNNGICKRFYELGEDEFGLITHVDEL